MLTKVTTNDIGVVPGLEPTTSGARGFAGALRWICAELFGHLPAEEEVPLIAKWRKGRGSWFGIEWVFPAWVKDCSLERIP